MHLKKEITIIIALVLVIVFLVSIKSFWESNIEKVNIQNYIKEDLGTKYPTADVIDILNMEKKTNEQGEDYYFIKAVVIEGFYTPCPTRTNFYYNYPEQNFVTQPPEYVVKNCKVCWEDPCTILYPEEAIIASHTLEGTEEVHTYVMDTAGVNPTVKEKEDRWVVTWNSPLSAKGYEIVISKDGKVISKNKLSQ